MTLVLDGAYSGQFRSNFPSWAHIEPPGGDRELPIYLLLDVSGSMQGTPIEAVRHGLTQFQLEVSSDPFARDSVRVAIITFGSKAMLTTGGLVEVESLNAPELGASGVTRLDLAFKELQRSMDRDVARPIKGGQKGDWRPGVFILTDGRPTDEAGNQTDALWQPARDAVVNRRIGQTKPSVIVAVGCGSDVDDDTLKAISTGPAFRIGTNQSDFVALFQYLSQSITNSMQPGGHPDDPFADLSASSDVGLIRIP
jgi:uncharacterized protein YegL